jgi:hypothetical protein
MDIILDVVRSPKFVESNIPEMICFHRQVHERKRLYSVGPAKLSYLRQAHPGYRPAVTNTYS